MWWFTLAVIGSVILEHRRSTGGGFGSGTAPPDQPPPTPNPRPAITALRGTGQNEGILFAHRRWSPPSIPTKHPTASMLPLTTMTGVQPKNGVDNAAPTMMAANTVTAGSGVSSDFGFFVFKQPLLLDSVGRAYPPLCHPARSWEIPSS